MFQMYALLGLFLAQVVVATSVKSGKVFYIRFFFTNSTKLPILVLTPILYQHIPYMS